VLSRTTDGFHVAEPDLRLRGPGDFLASGSTDCPVSALPTLHRCGAAALRRRKRRRHSAARPHPWSLSVLREACDENDTFR
jgi:RecG-like helicase